MFNFFFDFFPRLPRTPEEIQKNIEDIMANAGLTYHKTAQEALASDWRKIGDDMRKVMPYPASKKRKGERHG